MASNFFIILYSLCFLMLPGLNQADDSDETPTVWVPPDDATCIHCICVAMSGCDASMKCHNDVCGPFLITRPYWIDGYNPSDPEDVEAYEECTEDYNCAFQTVAGYLKKTAQDCDGNGVIDCYDYAAIHKYGGFGGCKDPKALASAEYATYTNKLGKCLYPNPYGNASGSGNGGAGVEAGVGIHAGARASASASGEGGIDVSLGVSDEKSISV